MNDGSQGAPRSEPASSGGVPALPESGPQGPGTTESRASTAEALVEGLRAEGVRVEGARRLAHGETRVFQLDYAGRNREGFVLGYEGQCYAYLNECPHWAVELDLGDGHFFDEELGRLYCKNHGALFSPTTGDCELGPCRGRALVSLRVRADGDDLLIDP